MAATTGPRFVPIRSLGRVYCMDKQEALRYIAIIRFTCLFMGFRRGFTIFSYVFPGSFTALFASLSHFLIHYIYRLGGTVSTGRPSHTSPAVWRGKEKADVTFSQREKRNPDIGKRVVRYTALPM